MALSEDRRQLDEGIKLFVPGGRSQELPERSNSTPVDRYHPNELRVGAQVWTKLSLGRGDFILP